VSRAFCEPALHALWRDMLPPKAPLWRLLAPPVSGIDTGHLADETVSERTYTEPARWAHFMWYVRFVQELHITMSDFQCEQKQLIHALVAQNGGETIFPSLQ
ncbi:hypothetical protein LXA43DRAFT_852550, partial [Ganoderma leucocontextum]